jgi:hypothetical protein
VRCDPTRISRELIRMNVHKNARLTFARRMELVIGVLEGGLSLGSATSAYGISVPSVRKWVGRYLAEGEAGLVVFSARSLAHSASRAVRRRSRVSCDLMRDIGTKGHNIIRRPWVRSL